VWFVWGVGHQVSGCFDLLHSGHVEFFRQAAELGDLYVRLGTDANVKALKNHVTMYKVQGALH
jgi:cytidyltransferase-like protein